MLCIHLYCEESNQYICHCFIKDRSLGNYEVKLTH